MTEPHEYFLYPPLIPLVEDDLYQQYMKCGNGPRPNMVRMHPETMRRYKDELLDSEPIRLNHFLNVPAWWWTEYPSFGTPLLVETCCGRILFTSDRNLPHGRWVIDYHKLDIKP